MYRCIYSIGVHISNHVRAPSRIVTNTFPIFLLCASAFGVVAAAAAAAAGAGAAATAADGCCLVIVVINTIITIALSNTG